MITSRRDTSNIYKGCLAYLRSSLYAELPDGQNFNKNLGIEYIVGTEKAHNVLNVPYSKAPTYFEIYFGKKYIYPTAYSLMGRRTNNGNRLKGWNFYGKNVIGQWVLLSSFSNSPFSQSQKKTFSIEANESYSAFKIQMTEPDTNGQWALCLGQIEVFGDIYSRPFIKHKYFRMKCTPQISKHSSIVFCLFNSILVS